MKLLNKEGQEIEKVDLGIVKAGESKKYEYLLYNETPRDVIEIKVEIGNKEVEILEAPINMAPGNKGVLKLAWSPSLTVKKGLKALIKVTASELYE